ncbi:MAG TPA: phosphoethanolamine--lipid A transferase [Steroidobacteraceae bacterium]|nr:phosphoethanolamine--lipid A transferase [Steroidobacteraceae bacterium]
MKRPTLRLETLVLIVAAYAVVCGNWGWWSGVLAGRATTDPNSWGFALGVAVLLIAIQYVLFLLPSTRLTVRPWLITCLLVTMATQYYIVSYRVLIDPAMIQNVLHTDAREASELIGWRPMLWTLVPALPAIALVLSTRLRTVSFGAALRWRALTSVAALLLAAVAVLAINRDFTSLMRNERGLRYLVTPANVLHGVVRNAFFASNTTPTLRARIGDDARQMAHGPATARPRIVVLVVGETARAANFSLLGYQRNTNPNLAKRNVVAFKDVVACGTSTEISVPCMFSPFGRADYDERRIRESEGLLDVLVKAGVQVIWRENQSGCKGVCVNPMVGLQVMQEQSTSPFCNTGPCPDEVLLEKLDEVMAAATGDLVIVLHQLGQHGPAYFERYPPRLRVFEPTCDTSELRRCSQQEVINTYDNGILYTDEVLAKLVDLLAAGNARFDSAMLYLSDHGELLGESGLYLHGMPYAFAPRVQLQIPMIFWSSPQFQQRTSLDLDCLKRRAEQPASHDNLFHSMLGLLDIETNEYQPDRDLFAGCRATAA